MFVLILDQLARQKYLQFDKPAADDKSLKYHLVSWERWRLNFVLQLQTIEDQDKEVRIQSVLVVMKLSCRPFIRLSVVSPSVRQCETFYSSMICEDNNNFKLFRQQT